MANTLKDQIDNLIGAGLIAEQYNNWLAAGARTIVDILKPEDLERHSTTTNVSVGSGLVVVAYRIWKVLVGGYEAKKYPAGYETQIVDNNSLLKSSVFTPAYIINAGNMLCYNGANCAGTIKAIAYPGVLTPIASDVDTDITGIPENMHYAVILYSSIQGRIKQMSNAVAGIATELSTSLQTLSALGTIPTLDVSTQLTRLESYILTDQDIELAGVEINQIQILIEKWMKYDADKVSLDTKVQVERLMAQLNSMKVKTDLYMQQTQGYALGLQQLQSEYHGLINLYLGKLVNQDQGQG